MTGIEFCIKIRDQATGAINKVTGNTMRMQEAMKKTGLSASQLQTIINSVARSPNIISSASIQSIRTANEETQKLSQSINKIKTTKGNWLGGKLKEAASSLPSFVTNPVVLAGAALGSSTALAKERASQRAAIDFATHGRGDEAISGVKDINNRFGLSNQAGLEGFKTFAGSVRGMNMPLEETLRMYESVGMAGAAMKLDGEAQKGIFLALGQMASKGTVSAEELRGQIGERLPGAFGYAAKAMGVTEQQLGKMMQTGQVMAKDFLPLFATELQKTFKEGAEKNAQDASAQFQRLQNTITEFAISIGSVLLPVMGSLAQSLVTVINFVQEWKTMFLGAALGLGVYVMAINAVTWAKKADTLATKAWTWAIHGLNAAWRANPFSFICTILGAVLLPVIMNCWDRFEGFRKFFYKFWETIKLIFSNIGDFFKKIFSPIFSAITAFKEGRYLDAGKAVDGQALQQAKDISKARDKAKEIGSGAMTAAGIPGASASTTAKTTAVADSASSYDSTDKVTSGGPRVMNITIGKLVEKIEIHATHFEKGMDNVKEQVEETFLRVLNSGAVAN